MAPDSFDGRLMTPPAKPRLIAFYLPQFHPIPENDEWWGRGFTEWTNVARARRLYPGHHQPHAPADLGFYDLRLPEVREAQAELAGSHGVSAFCYWHYWFAGRRILERPFTEVLRNRRPNFPFCLGWANESWSGVWHGAPHRILLQQTYPGADDHEHHFHSLLPAFLDDRYVKVDGKPLFVLYRPNQVPELERFADGWRERALRAGLAGMYFVGIDKDGRSLDLRGLDATIPYVPQFGRLKLYGVVSPRLRSVVREAIIRARARSPAKEEDLPFDPPNRWPQVYRYAEFVERCFEDVHIGPTNYPVVVPNWDNTPRSGIKGLILHGSTPQLFETHLRQALGQVANRAPQQRIVFVRSWNEWAEGNYLEPDLQHGRGYLQAVRNATSMRDAVSPTRRE